MTTQEAIPLEQARAPVAPPRSFLSFTARVLGNGSNTGGLHAVELHLSPGESSPWHVHHEEDEWFYLAEGEAEIMVGDDRVRLCAGDFAFGPRDVPHGFRITSSSPARMLLITVGGRFSDFVVENSEPVGSGQKSLPREPDIPRLIASAKKYGQEILGPLPN